VERVRGKRMARSLVLGGAKEIELSFQNNYSKQLKGRQSSSCFFGFGEINFLAQTQSLFEFAPRSSLIAFARQRHP
jgi:hypothetical protein